VGLQLVLFLKRKKKKKKQFEFILIALRAPDVRPLTSNKAEVSISWTFSRLSLHHTFCWASSYDYFLKAILFEGKMLVGSVHKRNVGQTNFHLLQHTQDGTDLYGRAKIIIIIKEKRGRKREMMFWRLCGWWRLGPASAAAQMSAPTEKSISRSTNWSYRAIYIHPCVCVCVFWSFLACCLSKYENETLENSMNKHTPHLKRPKFFFY
jgi:hypothetical protein